jgi:hypothetical protein
MQKSAIIPIDSIFDTENEIFEISIDKKIVPGKYQLKLYAKSPESQGESQPSNVYELIIKHN